MDYNLYGRSSTEHTRITPIQMSYNYKIDKTETLSQKLMHGKGSNTYHEIHRYDETALLEHAGKLRVVPYLNNVIRELHVCRYIQENVVIDTKHISRTDIIAELYAPHHFDCPFVHDLTNDLDES